MILQIAERQEKMNIGKWAVCYDRRQDKYVVCLYTVAKRACYYQIVSCDNNSYRAYDTAQIYNANRIKGGEQNV